MFNKNRITFSYLIAFALFATFVLGLSACSLTGPNNDNNGSSSNAYFSSPQPSNGAKNQPVVVALKWSSTGFAYYDIYMSEISPPRTIIANNITSNQFVKAGLNYNTSYFWKVVGHESDGTIAESPIWHFATKTLGSNGAGYSFIDHGVKTETPNYVKLLFEVVDDAGIPVPDLTLDKIEIYEDGQIISSSESFVLLQQYLSNKYVVKIVMMLDNSTSLRDKIPDIKNAALNFVNNIADSRHQIAVYEFSENTVLLQDFTSDKNLLSAAINSIVVGQPSTDLYGATITGAEHWQQSFTPDEIRTGAMILFTDGTDTQGSHTLNSALNAVSGKRVYTIGLGDEINPSILESIGNSGFFAITESSELVTTFTTISNEIERYSKSFYWLTYASPKRGDYLHTLIVRAIDNPINSYVEGTFSSADFFSNTPGLYINATAQNPSGVDTLSVARNSSIEADAYSFYFENPNYTWQITSGSSLITIAPQNTSQSVVTITAGNSTGSAQVKIDDNQNNLTKNVTVLITN